MATHLLVGNPTAQSGKNRERIDEALNLLANVGIDADFTGTRLDGTWRPRGFATGGYRFGPDGRFTELDSEQGGAYALGAGSLDLKWDEGGTERLAFLSPAEPDAARSRVIWVAGEPFDRTG